MPNSSAFYECHSLSTLQRRQFQQEVLRYCSGITWVNPYAVTLTFRLLNWPTRIDVISASENVHHFLNRLNRRVLGQRTSAKTRLTTFSVIECGLRPHAHLCIDCPTDMSCSSFKEHISASWSATRWARPEIDVQPCYQIAGWIGYMGKTRTKACYPDAIDWRNCY